MSEVVVRLPSALYRRLLERAAAEKRAPDQEGFSLAFVSADTPLCMAAEREGLATVNPTQIDTPTGGTDEP